MASRSTFRELAHSVAWQRQLRDRYLLEGTPPVPDLTLKHGVVRRVRRRIAAQIILKYEWLGTMAQTGYHYGLFFGPYCAGVCCVAAGFASGGVNAHHEFGLAGHELAVLARGACVHWAPPGANSKLVAWTCRLAATDTGAKLMIAYSDTDAGEIGTIYQACNWVYIGRGRPTRQFVAPNGRIYDQKIIYDTRRRQGTLRTVSWTAQREAFLAAGWREQLSNPKHKYVIVLDKSDTDLVQRIHAMRQPYPRRQPLESEGSSNQLGHEGAAMRPVGSIEVA